ncbi:hypothetical protein LTR85_009286 [Meristemomyces frigidus]|nr:hypothetical protein LTR85_009286 [Meristemomyces frigidus]
MTCKQIQQEVGELSFDINTITFYVPIMEHYQRSAYILHTDAVKPLKRVLRTIQAKHKLQSVHLHLGCQADLDHDLYGIRAGLNEVSGLINGLLRDAVKVRVSFDYRFQAEVMVPFDFRLGSAEVTKADLATNVEAISTTMAWKVLLMIAWVQKLVQAVFFD